MYITRLVSKEIFSPSNKIHWEVGGAKDLSAPLLVFAVDVFKNTFQKLKSLWINRSIKQWMEDILQHFL